MSEIAIAEIALSGLLSSELASETDDVHAARDEGLAQFAAEPARRSSDQYGFDHF